MASLASKCGGVTAAILVLAPIQGTPTAQAQTSPCGDRVVVAIGETLAQIARRCGVTVEAIMAANPLLPSPYFILPGLRIDIPQPARPEPANVIRYRVLPGDTLSSIARAHGVTMAQIFELNPDIDARTLRPGDIVRIRAGAVPPPAPPAERPIVRYTVRPGDTFGSIARDHNMTRAEIRELNPGLRSRDLRPGDVIRIRDSARPRPPADGPNIIRYTVRPGDTLFSIARAHGVTMAQIYEFNPTIDARTLRVGDVVRIRGGVVPPRPPASGARITVIGTLTREGAECQALRGDDGELYTLAGDFPGFRPGDRVRVEGRTAEISTCMQGTTIDVSRIQEWR